MHSKNDEEARLNKSPKKEKMSSKHVECLFDFSVSTKKIQLPFCLVPRYFWRFFGPKPQ